MLTTDLLMHRFQGESVVPKFLPLESKNLDLAAAAIACFEEAKGLPQKELDRLLKEFEGDSPDYRIKRGFAHILRGSFCTFETVSPLDPPVLRERTFALAARAAPSPAATRETLESLAAELTRELDKEVFPSEIQEGLYADLKENQLLIQFDAPTPEALVHRYNLSQAQGVFYRASQVVIHAYRNVPGEYKLLFRYLKLFQLMAYIEGEADIGFTITIDGPASLFKTSTRYGLALAKMLPALLHVTRWRLEAKLHHKDAYSGKKRTGQYALDSECALVSHYPPGKAFDSTIEEIFCDRWQATKTEWQLEREVDLIPIPGSVVIPDFRLVHPDGRTFLLEIVGYWRPEYLQKKFAQVRKANRSDFILAISERLNLEKAGVSTKNLPARVVWFKDKLLPKTVLAVLDSDG